MSFRYLHPESQKRVQSKSKQSLDDFDRQTLYSKIMVNLGTNPFMDTIQSPSCTSIQEHVVSHQEEISHQIFNQQNQESMRSNQVYDNSQQQSSRMDKNSPQSIKPTGPFQKKNLKKLLNKSKKDQANSDYDFTMQDSITDENPNIETKVQELNNNQTCNFTKFEILKKKNEKSTFEGLQGTSGNITTIKKAPLISQETAQNTQSTQVYLNSPMIKTIEKSQTPKSYKVNIDDLSQNNLSPFQYDQGVMNTNNSQKNSIFIQKTNTSNVPVDYLIENKEINNQLHVANYSSLGTVNEPKKNNQLSSDTSQLQNQYNICSNQQIYQSQINFQSQNNQIINSPILQSSQILQSQQQIYQSMFQPSPTKFQIQETKANILPITNNQINQFENVQDKFSSHENINRVSYQNGQANNSSGFIQSPSKYFANNQMCQDDGIMNINSPSNEQGFVPTIFNSGESALIQNNFGIPNFTKNVAIPSNQSLQSQQQLSVVNIFTQPYYNSQSYNNIQVLKKSDILYNSYVNQQSKDNINKNIKENNCSKTYQNEGRINSICYQQINQLKQSQISSKSHNFHNSGLFLMSSNTNLRDTTSILPPQIPQDQMNLLQIQQKLADNKNKIDDISMKINAQIQDNFQQPKIVQEINSNSSGIIQNSSTKEIYLPNAQKLVKREKENPITRLRNKSQPAGQRGIQKSPSLQSTLIGKKEENVQSKKSFNLKNDMSSLLYNEEEKIKKANKFLQNSFENQSEQQILNQKSQFANQINIDINQKNNYLNVQAMNPTQTFQQSQILQPQQTESNFIIQPSNQYIRESQTLLKQLQLNQTNLNSNFETNLANNILEIKGFENNYNISTKAQAHSKSSQKEKVSPLSNKDKILRSHSQKDVIQNQQDRMKNNSFCTQKNQPTPVKSRHISQYTPSYKQQTNNTTSYSQTQIPLNTNSSYILPKKSVDNKIINNPSEQKFQQPESPLKSIEPYSPFNTNRNSSSFVYDLNSFKNIQSSLSTAQYQQQQQTKQVYQQSQNPQQENIQTSGMREQNKIEISQNKFDKSNNNKFSNYSTNNMSSTKNTSNLTNNPKVLNEQTFNIKKQLNQQIDKKLKMNQSDQNSQKKELPKNPITCMRIHQKSNSISGQYGLNKFSQIQNSIK